MTSGLTGEEAQDFFDPGSNGQSNPDDEQPADNASYSYDALFNAPDYSTLIKGRRPAHAREYETKVKSVMKSGAIGSLRNGQFADAATFFRFGPGFSAATGDLCAANEKAAKAVDMLTAPDNPYFAFAFAALPFVAQLIRNHEQQFDAIPEVRKQAKLRRKERAARMAEGDSRRIATVKVPFMRREFKIHVGVRWNPFRNVRGTVRATTKKPEELVTLVFSDPKLQEALAKQGIEVVQVQSQM